MLLSKLLDLHLTRTIDRLKGEEDMSKFLQLAENIEADLKEFDREADELEGKRAKNKERARLIFNDHHSAQDRVAEGLKKMEAVMHDMSGSNSNRATEQEKAAAATKTAEEAAKLGEGSAVSSEASFQGKSDA